MKIWIDADACPAAIKEIVIRAALKRSIELTFIANKPLFIQRSPLLSAVVVEKGADVADQYIIKHVNLGDLVITQDIPLAAALVAKNIIVISVHGTLFTPENIRERLSIRNFMQEVRDTGGHTSGPRPFGNRDKEAFANALDKQLSKLLK
jgi:uncharacterized protein YaiI (UPF0178 family)